MEEVPLRRQFPQGFQQIFDTFKTPVQIRTLSADVTSNQADIPSLRYANLEVGKLYRVTIHHRALDGGNSLQLEAVHDGTAILGTQTNTDPTSSSDRSDIGTDVVFTATATALTFDYTEFDAGAVLEGNGTTRETFVMLEELPFHEFTTKWTP